MRGRKHQEGSKKGSFHYLVPLPSIKPELGNSGKEKRKKQRRGKKSTTTPAARVFSSQQKGRGGTAPLSQLYNDLVHIFFFSKRPSIPVSILQGSKLRIKASRHNPEGAERDQIVTFGCQTAEKAEQEKHLHCLCAPRAFTFFFFRHTRELERLTKSWEKANQRTRTVEVKGDKLEKGWERKETIQFLEQGRNSSSSLKQVRRVSMATCFSFFPLSSFWCHYLSLLREWKESFVKGGK